MACITTSVDDCIAFVFVNTVMLNSCLFLKVDLYNVSAILCSDTLHITLCNDAVVFMLYIEKQCFGWSDMSGM